MNDWRTKMSEDLVLRGLAPTTCSTYLNRVDGYVRYHRRAPYYLGTPEVREYLGHLKKLGRTASTLIVTWCALRFLYTTTLHRPEVMADVPRTRPAPPDIMPALTRVEVQTLFDAAERPYDRMLLRLLYGCGLRGTEARMLQADDVDARTRLLHIRHAKCAKDRSVPLSEQLTEELREHWRVHRLEGPWLFPTPCPPPRIFGTGTGPFFRDRPLSIDVMQRRFREIRSRAGLRRRVTLHDLRRAHATHLLEAGVDLRVIQVRLGHSSPTVTARYTAVSDQLLRRGPCLLGDLE